MHTYENVNKRETNSMLNVINPSRNQHSRAALNSITSKLTQYIHEVMLHGVGVKVGVCAWEGYILVAYREMDISSKGLAKGVNL